MEKKDALPSDRCIHAQIVLFMASSVQYFQIQLCSWEEFRITLSTTVCTVSFDWFLSGWEWILNLEFCLLKLLIFYQKLIWDLGLTLPHFESFKGQLISKANCQAVNSSKKRTNEFVFTSMRRVFFHFLEAFWNHLAFWLSLHVFDQNLHFCAKSFNFDRTYLNTG